MAVIGEKCTLLVNSYDTYEDCWDIFFTLLERYWPDNPFNVVLVSDLITYNSDKVTTITPGKSDWSKNLISALMDIETTYIIYMQEDYFLESPVDTTRLLECINILEERKDIGYLELTPYGARNKGFKAENGLRFIPWYSRYRASTQAAIWRRDNLLNLLRDWESGWEFELYAPFRSRLSSDQFCSLDSELLKKHPIISYTPTAIIKGQWAPFARELLEKEQIKVNYESRGYYRDPGNVKRRLALLGSLMRRPSQQIKSILSAMRR